MTSYLFKVALVGSVPESEGFRNKFVKPRFRYNQPMKTGIDFISVDKIIGGHKVTWQLWFFVGQPAFKSLKSKFFKAAIGAVVLYDINTDKSFQSVTSWIEDLWNNCGRDMVPVTIVGLGADRRNDNSIPLEKGQELTDKITRKVQTTGLSFVVNHYEASVRTGLNIDEPLEDRSSGDFLQVNSNSSKKLIIKTEQFKDSLQ